MSNEGRTPRPSTLRGDPLPPPRHAQFMRLTYPRDGRTLLIVAVGATVYGKLCHWFEGRPYPCSCPSAACPGMGAGWMPRWYGYLDAVEYRTQIRRIAVITEGAYRHCPPLQRADGSLRGKVLSLERMGRGQNAPVRCQVTTDAVPFDLPAPSDVVAILERIWGLCPGMLQANQEGPDASAHQEQLAAIVDAKGGRNGNGK